MQIHGKKNNWLWIKGVTKIKKFSKIYKGALTFLIWFYTYALVMNVDVHKQNIHEWNKEKNWMSQPTETRLITFDFDIIVNQNMPIDNSFIPCQYRSINPVLS